MATSPARDARFLGQPPAWALAACFAVLMLASFLLQVRRDAVFPTGPAQESVLYVQSGALLERLALSYDTLLADVYWIRALQHYGGTRRSTSPDKRYHLLYPLLSLTVTLDPLFNIAYRFGALFLAESWPGGPGRPDQAVALLKRGLEARPGDWRYMQDIGFVYYWWVHDFTAAAEWFQRGAAQPNAPWFLQSLAANTLAQGGDRQASRVLWQALASSDNEWLQRDANRRLKQLNALDEVDRLQALVHKAIAQGLTRPYSWQALQRMGMLRRLPVDPLGIAYELGPWSGDVSVNFDSPLQPLPAEPPRGSSR